MFSDVNSEGLVILVVIAAVAVKALGSVVRIQTSFLGRHSFLTDSNSVSLKSAL